MPVYTIIQDGALRAIVGAISEAAAIEAFGADCTAIEGSFPADQYYVLDGEPVPRETMSPSLDAARVVAGTPVEIIGLPEGCDVMAVGLPVTTVDGRTFIDTTGADDMIVVHITSPTHQDVSLSLTIIDIETARRQKATAISSACNVHILAGFTSSALGEEYTYPAKTTDQQNLASSMLASLLPGLSPDWTTPFWCADSGGAWEFRPHSAAQIRQVGQDAKAAILWAMGKNELLQAAIAAATTIDELEAITW